jgi:predicted hydrocarbon binding protein
MTDPTDLSTNSLVAISRESLNALRASLFRDLGGNAATYLQDAGYAGAGAVYEAFTHWLAARGGPAPDALSLDDFGRSVAEFFAGSGWGTLEFSTAENGVATIDSHDWAEAVAADGSEFSGCYFTTGLLVDFFSRITDAQVSVMETECRSMGAERCRFLVGTPQRLQEIYDQMAAG